MKLENFEKHAKVITPWLDIKESDETLDTKQKRQVQMISMTLEFAEAITGDEKTEKAKEASIGTPYKWKAPDLLIGRLSPSVQVLIWTKPKNFGKQTRKKRL